MGRQLAFLHTQKGLGIDFLLTRFTVVAPELKPLARFTYDQSRTQATC